MATHSPIRLRGSLLRNACTGVAFVAAWTTAAHAFAGALSFDQALALAEQRSPLLEARRASISASQTRLVSAGQLPDPQLAAGVENLPVSGSDRFDWNAEPMTMRRIALMQDMPRADKRHAQREAARAGAERELALLTAERLAVRRAGAVAWIDRHYAERRLRLFEQLEHENRLLRDTIDARVAGGSAMPAEAVMARQEALELAEQRDELQAAATAASAALERWTGMPAAATSGAAPALDVDPSTLSGRLERHGELLAFEPTLAMARADIQEAQAARRGDWGWELAYANRASRFGDMVSFQLRFQLPLSPETRQDPQLAARRHELARLQAEREDGLRRVQAELLAQLAELHRLERALERQRMDVLPLARQRVQLTLAGYEGGRADLAAVLAARRDGVRAQLKAIDLEAGLMRLRAQLTYLIAE